MKIAFLGNCQAQAIEAWTIIASSGIDVVRLPPVWLIGDSEQARLTALFESCDFIFAQRMAETNSVNWLRTSVMKATFGKRLISWPNVYFDGCFPGLRYLYHGQGGKILGPLDEYHFDYIINGYMQGLAVEDCVKLLTTPEIFRHHADPIRASFDQLAEREQGLDVHMSDYLVQRVGSMRLMYSMNHPCDHVLKELLLRVLGRAGISDAIGPLPPFPYTLDKIIIPFHPAITQKYHLVDDLHSGEFKGVATEIGDGVVKIGGAHTYDAEALVREYYRGYEEIGLTRA